MQVRGNAPQSLMDPPVYPFGVDGRKRRFSNTMMSYIHTAHALYGILSFFHCFSVSVWTGENDFSKTEKMSVF